MTFSQRAVEAAAAHILRELDDRGLLKGVDDDLFSEIGNDVAKAALTAALAVDGAALQGWQDISTAPDDGRMALVFRPLAGMTHDEPVAIKRLVGGNNFCWPATVPAGSKPYNPTDDGSCHVTHWMPIRQPPAASEGEERK